MSLCVNTRDAPDFLMVQFGKESTMTIRKVKRIAKARPTLEWAGVHLRRVFGFGDPSELDPFLLLDDFRSDDPKEYLAGFPWHPHRGIETITYVLAGTVEHGDSMGNRGVIGAGDVQWMTAGSGIIHQEMPKGDAAGRMHGFQLWANLPASLKMTTPRYQEVPAANIPEIKEADGASIRIICGRYGDVAGPVSSIAADPIYLDIEIPPNREKTLPVASDRSVFAYVFAGSGKFGDTTLSDNRTLVVFDGGEEVMVQAGDGGIRFLLVSGKPLREQVAWQGPIVMNTREELRLAFEELEKGTFIK
jgi:redox-sensitive bicupin YhaK (pirin superfamily)